MGHIFAPGDKEKKLFNLTQGHKHSIMYKLFRSKDHEESNKMEILDKVLGDDKSDLAKNARLCCMAALPDPKKKEEIWASLIDPNSK